MAKWLDNLPKRRRHRRHRRSYAHNRRHYRSHRRRHRYNPDSGGLVSASGAINRPGQYLTQAAVGVGGAYGVILAGNFVGMSLLPTMYADPSITGKVVRAAVRLGVGYAGDMLAKGMTSANRAALRVGGAIGIVGSLILDVLGTSFVLGSGDQMQTFQTALSQFGIGAGTAGMAAYMPARRGANILAGTGAYMDNRRGANIVAGLGEVAMGMGDSLLYRSFR